MSITKKQSKIDYDPTKPYAFSLAGMLNNDVDIIEKFCDSLKRRGYAYVRLQKDVVKKIDDCVATIDDFFSSGVLYKERFSKEPIFGYMNAIHKESFRMITGDRLSEHNFPKGFESVVEFAKFSDGLMYKLSILCSKFLFPKIITSAKIHSIPLFDANNSWGMLDTTKYQNDGSKIGMNCDEHYDPGLLSIHYRSTQPGLQLKNEYGKWVNPPLDKSIAIVWAGEVATVINPKIKHGVHRVINNSTKTNKNPRIALWYEICTSYQEHVELIGKSKRESLVEKEHSTGIPISKTRNLLYK